MIASQAAAASSVTYTELDYEAMLRRIERIFSLDNDAPEIAVANAEQLSPVAAAHRILTDSMSVLPIALLFNQSTLSLLQTLSICAAFPIMIIVCVIVAGFIKSMRADTRKKKLPESPPPEPVTAGETDAASE